MSPTADELAKHIARPLKAGDVLREIKIRPEHETYYVEVVNPDVMGARFEGDPEEPCIEVKTLTPYGPISSTRLIPEAESVWDGIVRIEDRTDRPSLKER